MLATPAFADESPDAAPWLQYENTGSRGYAKLAVTLLTNNAAKVVVVRHSKDPPIAYTAELSPAETAWFRMVLRTTNFSNPNRLEREADGGDGGVTTVRASVDGQNLQAKFGMDESFDDLSRNIFRLVRQAEMMKRLQRDHHAYDVRSSLTDNRVLQPTAFVEPLVLCHTLILG